jgi:hypothetical protein
MKYVRVYADQNGDSHFEDVEVAMSLTDFAPPAGGGVPLDAQYECCLPQRSCRMVWSAAPSATTTVCLRPYKRA